MKQSHDSSNDNKFPVTANETLSEKTVIFMWLLLMLVIGSKSSQIQMKQFFVFFSLPTAVSLHLSM